ncbi:MAG: hypothetical protein ACKVP0_02210 [Pirellulaceae bacterium]
MKFSIRDLLWLTVVAALAVGWWVDRAALKAMGEKQGQPTPQEFLDALRGREKTADSINPPVIQHIGPIVDNFGSVPNSSAPATNPPKS